MEDLKFWKIAGFIALILIFVGLGIYNVSMSFLNDTGLWAAGFITGSAIGFFFYSLRRIEKLRRKSMQEP